MNMHRSRAFGGVVLLSVFVLVTPLTALAAEKTYTDEENGFSVTLPSGWKKLESDEADVLFNAQRNDQGAQWLLSVSPLKNKKDADGMKKSMTKNPRSFGKQIKKELNKQFENSCSLTSAKKQSMGNFTGFLGMYNCKSMGVKVVIQFFSFVEGTNQYSAVGVATKAGYTLHKVDLNEITKSLTFTE